MISRGALRTYKGIFTRSKTILFWSEWLLHFESFTLLLEKLSIFLSSAINEPLFMNLNISLCCCMIDFNALRLTSNYQDAR